MRVALAVAVALGVGSIVVADPTIAAIRKSTNIPAQGLDPALKEFAASRDLNVLYLTSIVRNLSTPGAVGEITTDEALTNILSGTGLTYKYLSGNTITILPLEDQASGLRLQGSDSRPQASSSQASVWERLRLAQADTTTSTGAQSQSGEAGTPQRAALEEVVVTAQKREEQLKDVPISISVLSGVHLDRSSDQSINDALNKVPGVAVTDLFLGGGSQLTVRGVTASLQLFQGATPIAYYLDAVPFSFVRSAIVPDPSAYDLERVEVLRGPQGTLYGASALNGVVRVLTKDADLNRFEFKTRTSASSTQDGGENYRGDVAINVPLIEGKLAARAVVGYQDWSGWIDKPNDENANSSELSNVRLKVNAQPTDDLAIAATLWRSRDEYGAPSNSLDNLTHPSLLDEPISTDYDAFGLRIGYDFARFSLTSNTSYLDFLNRSQLDVAAGSGLDLRLETRLPARTFSQEVILNSTGEGNWRWTLGGVYRDSQDTLWQFLPGIYTAPNDLDYFSESFAIFGEMTRLLLNERLELTAGLRYFEDDVRQEENSRLSGVPASELLSKSSTFDSTTPRFVVTWHATEQSTLYASYSQGFRSGSDQIPAVLAVAPIPSAQPDKLTNYEIGAKSDLMGGRLSFETALYYVDWQDIQLPIAVRVPTGPGVTVDLQTIINGESASGLGADIGLVARPIPGLELGINASWNDLTMDEDVTSGSGGLLLLEKGERLSFSPEYTAGASADYTFPFGSSNFEGQLSTSANYISARHTVNVGAPPLESESTLIGSASFAVSSADHWTATLFVDNVSNEQNTPFRHAVPYWASRIRPRTVGIQLEYQF